MGNGPCKLYFITSFYVCSHLGCVHLCVQSRGQSLVSPSVTLYRCVLAEGLPLTSELVNSARLTGCRDPPGSNAPPVRVYRHMLSHPASVGAGIQTRVLGLAQPPLYQLSQLHSLDFTLFLRQHLIDLSLLESNSQITVIFLLQPPE